jgi:hypothetical protein
LASNTHGGYRKPANPAPVSGPGKYARRTDGGPAQVNSTVPDQPYGDAKQQHADERIAPMGGKAPLPPAPTPGGDGGQPSMAAFAGLGFGDPSQRPNEPVTHGVDIGPGGGSDVLNLPTAPNPAQGTGQMTSLLQRLSATDATGILGQLMQAAQDRGA